MAEWSSRRTSAGIGGAAFSDVMKRTKASNSRKLREKKAFQKGKEKPEPLLY